MSGEQAGITAEEALEALAGVLRRGGLEVQVLDLTALAAIARPVAVLSRGGERLPVVAPRDPGAWASAREFDMEMAAAGLRRYIRAPLPGDKVPPDAPPVVLVG
jgi:hypothetical protein